MLAPTEHLVLWSRIGPGYRRAVEPLPGCATHAGLLEREWDPRVELLSPLDQLIYHRPRTAALSGFDYRAEMYLPPSRRRWGYYVLPILCGERLIGRADPSFDPAGRTLIIHATHAEPGAWGGARPRRPPSTPWPPGSARRIIFQGALPPAWSRPIRAIG